MEHGRFEYSAIAQRPKWELPNGARVAVWITPNVEHYHWGKPAIALTQMTATLARRAELCLARLRRARRHLAHHGNPGAPGFVATAALNSEVCRATRRSSKRATGSAGNGWRMAPTTRCCSPACPRRPSGRSSPPCSTRSRKRPARSRGWLGPALTETDHTLDLSPRRASSMSPTGATTSCPMR